MISYGLQKQEPRFKQGDIVEEDYRVKHAIDTLFKNAKIPKSKADRKHRVDNVQLFFPPAYLQGQMFSCTANAAAAVIEYYSLVMRKLPYTDNLLKTGQYRPLSRLFIYYNARRLIDQWMFERGASIRSTLGALKLFGAPFENFWPYEPADYWVEPSPFVFSLAAINKIDTYVLHESQDREKIICDVKKYLQAGVPSVFGFKVFETHDLKMNRKPGVKIASKDRTKTIGIFPFPDEKNEKETDRHCVVAVGYDDEAEVVNPRNKQVTKGAFKIRNSWGRGWGEDGYGWLPYEYVRKDHAYNFWSLLQMKFVNVEDFGIIIDEVVLPA
jgi:C1A family cysteine protease